MEFFASLVKFQILVQFWFVFGMIALKDMLYLRHNTTDFVKATQSSYKKTVTRLGVFIHGSDHSCRIKR